MNPRTNPVVIAGAGPAGLIAAVLLVRAGQRVLALEKMAGWQNMIHATKQHAVFDLECIRGGTV
jgi:2-polyprenyl-6-methoxyphenol hydroxylase-like FAD-dependent oxidoreductase